MLKTSFIRKNKLSFAIILFLIVLSFLHTIKPNFIYNKNGTFREFGLGYLKKTVLPMWLIVIITAILCYLFILYYITVPIVMY